ncbi:acyl-CoA thioesterase [Sphingoaurantiacus capsulatus]|uniref:Acyl-CoA thioesterase n=1 Tax=Sphingoaurantiacus capsulatus TaxID=1771310 RepID=A0ABV7X850_9SPHN
MAERPRFELGVDPQPEDIDELGHVNNAVYVRWIQDIAVAHWRAVARAEDVDRYVWVVTRHEIDYRRATKLGERLIARTWVGEPAGARFDRFVEFVGEDGNVRVSARTVWALVELATMRPMRIQPEIAAPFLG